jgi:histone H3/H4
MRSGTRFSAGA